MSVCVCVYLCSNGYGDGDVDWCVCVVTYYRHSHRYSGYFKFMTGFADFWIHNLINSHAATLTNTHAHTITTRTIVQFIEFSSLKFSFMCEFLRVRLKSLLLSFPLLFFFIQRFAWSQLWAHLLQCTESAHNCLLRFRFRFIHSNLMALSAYADRK